MRSEKSDNLKNACFSIRKSKIRIRKNVSRSWVVIELTIGESNDVPKFNHWSIDDYLNYHI